MMVPPVGRTERNLVFWGRSLRNHPGVTPYPRAAETLHYGANGACASRGHTTNASFVL